MNHCVIYFACISKKEVSLVYAGLSSIARFIFAIVQPAPQFPVSSLNLSVLGTGVSGGKMEGKET